MNKIELIITPKQFIENNQSKNWIEYMTEEQKNLYNENKNKPTFKERYILGIGFSNGVAFTSSPNTTVVIEW